MVSARRTAAMVLALPVALAKDAVWSGAAPDGAAFTGHSAAAHAGGSDQAVQDDSTRAGSLRSQAITRQDDHDQVVTLPVYAQPASAETTEARLSSAGVVVLAAGVVAGLGGLAAYAMGYWPRGKRVAKKRRAVSTLDMGLEEQQPGNQEEEQLLDRAAQAALPEQVATTVWSPLPPYQFTAPAAPAALVSSAATTYAAAPMMAVPSYAAAPAPAYATPAPPVYAAAPAPTFGTPPAPAYYLSAPASGAPFDEPMVMPSEPLPRVSY